MEDSVSAAITVSASLVTVVTSVREVCNGFSSLINEIIKKNRLLENARVFNEDGVRIVKMKMS